MSSSLPTSSRFAIVGGGITGLTAAYRIIHLLPQSRVELFEASDRLGGVLHTHRQDGLLIERGADSFINKLPWAVELCRELGLEEHLIPTNPDHRRALVVRDGQLHPVPEGFVVISPRRLLTLLITPLLSWRGKLRVLREPWIRCPEEVRQKAYDESVASFATRRLGREAFERLVQPLLAGIYTADPYQLSLAATMPEAIAAEREHGSLYRAAVKQAANSDNEESGARYASFVTPSEGLGQLVEALASHLSAGQIHLNSPMVRMEQTADDHWKLLGAQDETFGPFHGVVVATPAPNAAKLLADVDSQLSELLRQIPYASSAVVSLSFRRDQIADPLDGFGLVVPTVENRPIVAVSFSSVKFAGRAPRDDVLVRVFLGGALNPEQVALSDEALRAIAVEQLRELVGLSGEPVEVDVVRWHEKMPQYHVGHVQLIRHIEQRVAEQSGLELAGNAYHGVGIPQCIHSADKAARRLAATVCG